MYTRIDAVLILWNPDVIQLVSLVLKYRNLKSCGIEPSDGEESIERLMMACSPTVVVFDLDPPYDRSATVALRLLDRFPECSFVMTCADSGLALKRAPWLARHPMLQKPYEMDEIARIVRSMVKPERAAAMSAGV
jgi:hypothetical protein